MGARFPLRIQSPPPSSVQSLKHSICRAILKPIKVQMVAAPLASKRPTCPNCCKPSRLCLCIRFRNLGLQNKVSVTILQHSFERKHPLNSARIAKLGLANVNVFTVSDVSFDARVTIRLLQPDSGQYGCGSLGFRQVTEMTEAQKGKVDDVSECSSDRGNLEGCEFKGTVLKEEKESRVEEVSDEVMSDDKMNPDVVSHEQPVITAAIKKNGAITELNNAWVSMEEEKPIFDQILASQLAADALAKGFVVNRFQKKQKEGSAELEEYAEFEIVVPSGSLLLFPSDKAVSGDELKGMPFVVSNLIVLDGTWAKAMRMYSENPWLRLLPHLKLDLDKSSLFAEVRHQPKAGYLSTIESIVYAMRMLGDKTEGLDNLLDVFESMVGDQRRCKEERLSKLSSD